MSDTQKNIIEGILTDTLGDSVSYYDIRNCIEEIGKVDFGTDGAVDTAKLLEATYKAKDFLESVTVPTSVMAAYAVYENQIFIAMAKIQTAIK